MKSAIKHHVKAIDAFQFMEMCHDEEAARAYLENIRWAGRRKCPVCAARGKSRAVKGRPGFYRCRTCRERFTVRTETILGRSHISLHKWLFAIYLLQTSREKVSSLQLSKELGITQKSAWFLLRRLREACDVEALRLSSEAEEDKTYIGGKERNKHSSKKLRTGRGTVGKMPVNGMRQRKGKGKVVAKPLKSTNMIALHSSVHQHIVPGSAVYTDGFLAYNGLIGYQHESVRHSAQRYVHGMAHTNGRERWSVKYMVRYVSEFAFRLNEGCIQRDMMDRMQDLCRQVIGKRLTYCSLIS